MKLRSSSSTLDVRTSHRNNNVKNFKVECEESEGGKNILYNMDEVPLGFREPYIKTGYRKPYITTWQSLQSLFHINNETFNIWSHLVTLIYFVVRYTLVLLVLRQASSPLRYFFYPMLSSAIGSWTVYAMSSIAHTFNSKSEEIHSALYFLDYAGISIYTYTSGQVMYYYNRPINTGWRIFESALLYTSIGVFLSFTATFSCCLSKIAFKGNKTYATLIRVIPVFAGWLNTVLSLIVGVTLCTCNANTSFQSFIACNDLLITYFRRHCFCSILAGVIYGSRLPERLLPGKFDIIGNSHHFLHVFSALSTEYAFKILEVALESRQDSKNELLAKSLVGITSVETVLPTFIVFFGNIAIAFCFVRSIFRKDFVNKKK